jgi:UDP-N-acetylglucosamine 2-epimerase (non-hydrolysing)
MRKIMVVFGTRPEAIKMCPLVNELKSRINFETIVCVTGQHREMLDQVLKVFNVVPDFDLSIMKTGQTLFDITISILSKMKDILEKVIPDIVLVHGDTSTTFITSLACFYLKIPVGHVEAGLRTYDLNSPYPEEFNRQAVGVIAQYHFAPTEKAKLNLINEGKNPKNIYVTGNTAIDALKTTIKLDYFNPILEWAKNSRLILITAHRRENLGQPMINMFRAIKRILEEYQDIKAIYPIHLNPTIRDLAYKVFNNNSNLKIIEPLDVIDFHNILAKSYLVLTDSGGIQEEAPSLGKPVLVMRDTTERPEGVEAGTLKLVGTNENLIYLSIKELLDDKVKYNKMINSNNPYGDGLACLKIVEILSENS